MDVVPRERHEVGARSGVFRRKAGQSFRPFFAHAEFESGYETNDSAYEIFSVALLVDDAGVELLVEN